MNEVPFPLGAGQTTLTTKHGQPVVVRHISTADADLLVDLFYRLSERTRHLRFLRAMHKVSPARVRELARQLSDINPQVHAALIATVEEEGQTRAVAVARLMREEDQPESAELAVVVRDDYQGAGLGTALVDLILQIAMVRGLKTMIAYTLAENRAMQALVRKLGLPFRSTTQQGETVLEIEVLGGMAGPGQP